VASEADGLSIAARQRSRQQSEGPTGAILDAATDCPPGSKASAVWHKQNWASGRVAQGSSAALMRAAGQPRAKRECRSNSLLKPHSARTREVHSRFRGVVCPPRDHLCYGHCHLGSSKPKECTVFFQGGAKRAGCFAQFATVLSRRFGIGKCRLFHTPLGWEQSSSRI
jgi:hypothetical protein